MEKLLTTALLAASFFSLTHRVRYCDVTPATPMLDINWTPYSPKYVKGTLAQHGIDGSSQAFISVPQDYFGDYGTQEKTFKIRVRRIERGLPKKHLWLIPGGPGQHSNIIEHNVAFLNRILPKNVWLYFMDHRGTGKSGKIASSKKQGECIMNPSACFAVLPFPVQIMSIHNAALDFIAVTRSLKKPEEEWFLRGSSYGGLLVDYILRFAPDLFVGALLNSMIPHLRHYEFKDADILDNLVSSCEMSKACRSRLGPAAVRNSLTNFFNASNSCTESTQKLLCPEAEGKRTTAEFSMRFSYFIRVLNILLDGNLIHLLVTFLNTGAECRKTRDFLRILHKLLGRREIVQPKFVANSNQEKLQHTLNSLINGSESLSSIEQCLEPDLFKTSFHSPCFAVFFYKHSGLQPFFYDPIYPSARFFNTRLIYTASRLDPRTLHDVAKAHFDSSMASEKLFLSIDSASHAGISETQCIIPTMHYLLYGFADSRQEAEECVADTQFSEDAWKAAFETIDNWTTVWIFDKMHPLVSFTLTLICAAIIPSLHALIIMKRSAGLQKG